MGIEPKDYTLQDYFNIAWDHAVVKKARPAYEANNEQGGIDSCLYRGPNGVRCLIGAAIRDEDYKPTIENKRAPFALTAIGYSLPTGVGTLQQCHDALAAYVLTNPDTTEYSRVIEDKLRAFAKDFDLEIPA